MTTLADVANLNLHDVDNALNHYRKVWQNDPTAIDKINQWLETRHALTTGTDQRP